MKFGIQVLSEESRPVKRCLFCDKEINSGFRYYYCHQGCWHGHRERLRAEEHLGKDVDYQDCLRIGKDGCKGVLKGEQMFNGRWCSHYCCVMDERELVAEEFALQGRVNNLDRTMRRLSQEKQAVMKNIQFNRRRRDAISIIRKEVETKLFETQEWFSLRVRALDLHGRKCANCGASPTDGGTIIQADHKKSIKHFPELMLELDNIQPACRACNLGKGDTFEGDFTSQYFRGLQISERGMRYRLRPSVKPELPGHG